MPTKIDTNVLSWADDLDSTTIEQAATTASMPFVNKPLALMPDAHLGLGSTVGSVVATTGAIMPACVGVDIGCGMIAQKLTPTAEQIRPHLTQLHERIAAFVPSGIPRKGNRKAGSHTDGPDTRTSVLAHLQKARPDAADATKTASQFGTLGSGNHFVEVCEDENGSAWIVLHSGSRNPGNTIARHHIAAAKGLMKDWFIELPDPDLAYLVEGTAPFEAYINDMRWAQLYAFENRQAMMDAIAAQLELVLATDDTSRSSTNNSTNNSDRALGTASVLDGDPINCHHNYTTQEHHHGKDLWVTRKGAILAREGTRGVIPGSMATGSFIVSGLGSPSSYCSASHGAGRAMSRTKARKTLSTESLDARMHGIAWNNQPKALLDEHPDAYKDLGHVMDNQSDLVEIEHRLTTILNYKGT